MTQMNYRTLETVTLNHILKEMTEKQDRLTEMAGLLHQRWKDGSHPKVVEAMEAVIEVEREADAIRSEIRERISARARAILDPPKFTSPKLPQPPKAKKEPKAKKPKRVK